MWECASRLLGLLGRHATCYVPAGARALALTQITRLQACWWGRLQCMHAGCVCVCVGGGLVELVLTCFAGHGPYRWALGARRLPAGPSGISKHSSMHPAEQHPCSLTLITRAMLHSALPAFCGYNAHVAAGESLWREVVGGGGVRWRWRWRWRWRRRQHAITAGCCTCVLVVIVQSQHPWHESSVTTHQGMKLIYLTQQIEGARPRKYVSSSPEEYAICFLELTAKTRCQEPHLTAG